MVDSIAVCGMVCVSICSCLFWSIGVWVDCLDCLLLPRVYVFCLHFFILLHLCWDADVVDFWGVGTGACLGVQLCW